MRLFQIVWHYLNFWTSWFFIKKNTASVKMKKSKSLFCTNLKNLRISIRDVHSLPPEHVTFWFIASQFIFIILKSNIVISIFDLKPKFQRIHWLLISNTFLTTNKTSQYSEKTIQHIIAFLVGILPNIIEEFFSLLVFCIATF